MNERQHGIAEADLGEGDVIAGAHLDPAGVRIDLDGGGHAVNDDFADVVHGYLERLLVLSRDPANDSAFERAENRKMDSSGESGLTR